MRRRCEEAEKRNGSALARCAALRSVLLAHKNRLEQITGWCAEGDLTESSPFGSSEATSTADSLAQDDEKLGAALSDLLGRVQSFAESFTHQKRQAEQCQNSVNTRCDQLQEENQRLQKETGQMEVRITELLEAHDHKLLALQRENARLRDIVTNSVAIRANSSKLLEEQRDAAQKWINGVLQIVKKTYGFVPVSLTHKANKLNPFDSIFGK